MKLVTAAIIRNGEDILVVRRGAGDMLAGFWEFPGGPVEHPETLQECLERELFAVLDIATQVGQVIAVCDHEYESGSIKLVAMEAQSVRGSITLSVHDKMRWLPASELPSLKLVPAAIPIVQSLLQT
jgi:8-oxo-dGTP diphosphatase